jgi:surface-anchored protein
MKTRKNIRQIASHAPVAAVAILMGLATASRAQTPLSEGHTDIGIAYDPLLNEWELHVHHEETDTEYFPATDALLLVKDEARTLVPAGAEWSFLGTAGSEFWELPQVENPNLLFLGFGAEEIAPGVFANDQLTLSLKGVTGPGEFAVYDTGGFNPVVWMNSRDGIDASDSRVIPVGLHQDLNWAFSAPGDYTILFEASGTSLLNGATSSGNIAYLFHIVPEPSVLTLAAAGCGLLALSRRRRET